MRHTTTAFAAALLVILYASVAHGTTDNRRWSAAEVGLRLSPAFGMSQDAALTALRLASGTWNEVGTGPLLIVDDAGPTVSEVALDGINAVFFVQDGWMGQPDALALTFSHVDNQTGEVLEVDIAINAGRYHFTVGEPVLGAFDLQNLLTHELGHALGLGHLDDADSTMFAEIAAQETGKRALSNADVDAFLALYESIAGGSAAGCSQSSATAAFPMVLLLALLLPRRRLPLARRTASV